MIFGAHRVTTAFIVAVKPVLRLASVSARASAWLAASVRRQLEHPVPTPSPCSGLFRRTGVACASPRAAPFLLKAAHGFPLTQKWPWIRFEGFRPPLRDASSNSPEATAELCVPWPDAARRSV